MAMIQLILWLALAVLLYALLGAWLKQRFRNEAQQRTDREDKQWNEWRDTHPTGNTSTELKQRIDDYHKETYPQRAKTEARAKRWNWARGITAYTTLTFTILAAAAWIPLAQDNEYSQGWYATSDAFDQGWTDGCEFLMATSDGYRWYSGDKEYDQAWCEGLNQIRNDSEFWWDYRPRQLAEGSPIEDYEDMAGRAGWYLALRTAFAAQPTLCFENDCWDWDRMETRLLDLAMESWDAGIGF